MPGKVAYVMSRFPHLPETFILREMMALEQLGWKVELYPLILQGQELVHPEARPWLERAHSTPWFSFGLAAANTHQAIMHPHRYFSLWARLVRGNFSSPKFLLRALLLFPRAVWMADAFLRDGIEHIHAHYATHPALVAWLIHALTGIPYSVTVHAHDIFVEKPMLATKLRDAAFIASISEFNRDYLVEALGPWVRQKISIVRCGIDPAYYGQNEQPRNGRLEILSVGSLQPYKGFAFLIEACALLRDQGIPFRCRIVGGGDLRGTLEELIQNRGLIGSVELLGARTQDDVSRLLCTGNCYVQPSIVTSTGKMEGIPVAVMEAMISGLPVIASALSGLPELVKPGETGWLVPPGNSALLAEALAEIYARPAEARRRAALGRQWVQQEFNLETNVHKLAALFAESAPLRQPADAQHNLTKRSIQDGG
ncbi:MAG: glycosyltransferase [Anaerolineales bacterium]